MPTVDIEGVARVGVVKDLPAQTLAPEVWTEAFNVRSRDGEIVTIGGQTSQLGVPPVAPHFLSALITPATTFWLWAGLEKAYVFNGVSHTEITRVSGDYTTTLSRQWGGTILGGVQIFNNGVDVPQAWLSPTVGTKLVDLPNWPSDTRCRAIRAFGPHLIAINITKSGVTSPHMVKWSHPADPGSVPISWDETDPTKDAGENELPDVESGLLLDLLPLSGRMYLYKEASIWVMRFIGGRFVFSFDEFLVNTGLLAQRCVQTTGDGKFHFLATSDDLIVHNGAQPQSVVTGRMRKTVFNAMDSENFKNSFVFVHREFQEMWFCYPEVGNVHPTRALIWNYVSGAVTEAEVNFQGASSGSLESVSLGGWDTLTQSWDEITAPWSSVSSRQTLVVDPTNSRILALDSGDLVDGVIPLRRLERKSLGLVGQKRDRTPIVDFTRRKQVIRLWPRVSGGPVRVRVGTQARVVDQILWGDYVVFDPLNNDYVDVIAEGRAIAIEFSSATAAAWALEGYKLDLSVLGEF